MTTLFPELMEKVARVFGASRPDPSDLAEQAIPYENRKHLLMRYYQRKAQEDPSSLKRLMGVGGVLGAGAGAASMFAARKRMPMNLARMLVASGAGAAMGATGGAVAHRVDKGNIAHARGRAGASPEEMDSEMMQHIRHARQMAEAKKTLDAALPSVVEEHQRTKRHGMSLEHSRQESSAARDEATKQRKEQMLSSITDKAGATAVSRGLFGKDLHELNTVELATVVQRLES